MKKMIILNHKMNLEYDEVIDYIGKINNVDTSNNIVICPSTLYLESFINNCSWGIGAQNVYYEVDGEYTGEVSTLQLKSLGIEYAMIGHYERKKYFDENDEIINKKLIACLDSNIVPILCFGETGKMEDIKSSLDKLLKDVDNINFIVFAYEPLCVTDKLTKEQIRDDVEEIYDYLYSKYKHKPNIVYGGGVVESDAGELLKIDNLNGILVGKISADIDKVLKIIDSAN